MNEAFHFLRPGWLLALPLYLGLVIGYTRSLTRGGVWQTICDPALLPYVVDDNNTAQRRPAWLLGIAGCVLLTALAGPTWEQEPVPVFRGESALVIALVTVAAHTTRVAGTKPAIVLHYE